MTTKRANQDMTHDSFSPPRRVEILHAGDSRYFKAGQFAYALSWDMRGGNHCINTAKPSRRGVIAYLVSKTKDMRGGALWLSEDGVRFTARGAAANKVVDTLRRFDSSR